MSETQPLAKEFGNAYVKSLEGRYWPSWDGHRKAVYAKESLSTALLQLGVRDGEVVIEDTDAPLTEMSPMRTYFITTKE